MAKVFKRNKAINHFLWPFLADFHKATPFQGKTQSKIKSIKGELIPSPAFKFKKESNICGGGGIRTHERLNTSTASPEPRNKPLSDSSRVSLFLLEKFLFVLYDMDYENQFLLQT